MASHIPLVEEDRVIGLDGKPLAPLPVNAWAGLPFEVHPHMRRGEVADRYNPHPLLLVHLRSHGRSRIRSGRTVFDVILAPGQVDVFAAGFRMDHASWDCTPGEVLAVEIDPERVRTYLHDDGFAVTRRRGSPCVTRSSSSCSPACAARSTPAAHRASSSPKACRWHCCRDCARAMASPRCRDCRRASSRRASSRTPSTSSRRTSART